MARVLTQRAAQRAQPPRLRLGWMERTITGFGVVG